MKVVHRVELAVDGLHADHVHIVHIAVTAQAEQAVRAKTAETARQASNAPDLESHGDGAVLRKSEVGYTNLAANPASRGFIRDTDLEVSRLSNHFEDGPATVAQTGRFRFIHG